MQCFVVQSNEIEGRLDPSPYHPVRIAAIKKIRSMNTKLLPLKEVVIFKKEIITSNPSGLPYIGLENIESNMGILIPSKDTKESFGNACTFKKGDILFPKLRPYLNKVYLAEFDGVCSTEFHVLNAKKCNSRYLFSFLNSNLVVSQTSYLMTGNALPRLQTDEIKGLLIPLPSDEIQNAIERFMQSAYNQKKQKEAEAQKLLTSTDGYVLDELGIKLPEVENKMCFVINSYDAMGRRLDPKAYLEIPRTILEAIKNCKFSIKPLSEIIIENIAGNWGSEPLKEGDLEDFVLINVLRNTNFDNQLNLNLKEVAQRLIPLNKLEKIKLWDGDLLIEKSGGSPTQPVGRVAIFENIESDYTFSNFLQCIRVNNKECLPYYLFSFLKTLYRMNYMEYVQNQTTGIKNLIMEEYLSIPISLPPLEIQNKIAEEVKRRISEAERLKAEATKIIEEAKKRVEVMILGD